MSGEGADEDTGPIKVVVKPEGELEKGDLRAEKTCTHNTLFHSTDINFRDQDMEVRNKGGMPWEILFKMICGDCCDCMGGTECSVQYSDIIVFGAGKYSLDTTLCLVLRIGVLVGLVALGMIEFGTNFNPCYAQAKYAEWFLFFQCVTIIIVMVRVWNVSFVTTNNTYQHSFTGSLGWSEDMKELDSHIRDQANQLTGKKSYLEPEPDAVFDVPQPTGAQFDLAGCITSVMNGCQGSGTDVDQKVTVYGDRIVVTIKRPSKDTLSVCNSLAEGLVGCGLIAECYENTFKDVTFLSAPIKDIVALIETKEPFRWGSLLESLGFVLVAANMLMKSVYGADAGAKSIITDTCIFTEGMFLGLGLWFFQVILMFRNRPKSLQFVIRDNPYMEEFRLSVSNAYDTSDLENMIRAQGRKHLGAAATSEKFKMAQESWIFDDNSCCTKFYWEDSKTIELYPDVVQFVQRKEYKCCWCISCECCGCGFMERTSALVEDVISIWHQTSQLTRWQEVVSFAMGIVIFIVMSGKKYCPDGKRKENDAQCSDEDTTSKAGDKIVALIVGVIVWIVVYMIFQYLASQKFLEFKIRDFGSHWTTSMPTPEFARFDEMFKIDTIRASHYKEISEKLRRNQFLISCAKRGEQAGFIEGLEAERTLGKELDDDVHSDKGVDLENPAEADQPDVAET